MSASDLESLTIANVRGYVEPFRIDFEKGRRLCIVYGENGTGKTTLCDALELLGSGTMGSLDGKGLGRPNKYWHSAASKGRIPGKVELRAKGASYSASFDGGSVSWEPPLQKPRVTILRRSQLLEIVTATAADRYKAIAELVDVANVERSEQVLADLVKETEREAEHRASRVNGAREILEKLFASAAGNGDPVEWARGEGQQDVAQLLIDTSAFEELRSAYEALERRRNAYATLLESLQPVRTEVDDAGSALMALERESLAADAEVLDLLQVASRMLSAHPHLEACPLCGSSERAGDLDQRVQARLAAMGTLRVARLRKTEAERALEGAEVRVSQTVEGYVSERANFQQLMTAYRAIAGVTMPDAEPPLHLADLADWVDRNVSQKAAWTYQRDQLVARTTAATNLGEGLKTYDENYMLAEGSATLLAALKQALEQIRATRHTFVNALLAEISDDVGVLYEIVHPGEGLAKINLSLDAKKRASLELATQFQASDAVPPQAYFSDSHLDTLGLCVFLALAKRRSPGTTILVLDDVLASVDEPHVDRLIEMIYDEAKHFRHVVVTTHYRPWREKLRWGWLKQGPCQLVEFGRWAAHGPTLVRSIGQVERLRQELARPNLDGQIVCAKAGVVLEAALDFLTELYQCRLPRKPRNEWTLGDLLPAIGKKLRSALRVEVPDPAEPTGYKSHALGPNLDELQRIAQTRNVFGAHFNKLAYELLDSDAEHFARKVLELAELLVDAEHGWPRSNKSGSYWATAKETRRLHPLQEPG